jgi:putative endonuclease
MKKSSLDKGRWAEEVAASYLKKKSYQIIFKNWRAERGDIDIIALKHKCLVFVEVKGGSTQLYGPPELRITHSKKRQLYKLANLFLQKAEEYSLNNEDYRFDVVVIDGHPNKYEIRHYQNAFGF